MSSLIEDRTSSQRGYWAEFLPRSWSGIAAGLRLLHSAWKTRQASVAMWNLGPEMLRDIGIEGCEIDWAVRHGRPARHAVRRDDHGR
jgi:hypothetical protein